MIKLCLFDLDDTLIRTADIKEDREACKNNKSPTVIAGVKKHLTSTDRILYTEDELLELRAQFPDLKFGIFTRSPRSYVETVIEWAYPNFDWDVIITYEDVRRTKPHGEGIIKAMDHFSFELLDEVVLVGDTDVDVRSAYNAGCYAVIDKQGWPYKYEYYHWNALKLIPDAIVCGAYQLAAFLRNPLRKLPELERTLDGHTATAYQPRFEKINHFIPAAAGGDRTAYPIHTCGRSFANYDSLAERKKWHKLSTSIANNKDSTSFPQEWIDAIRTFITATYDDLFETPDIIVSVVPHRPGRQPRLEMLLQQLQASINSAPIPDRNVTISIDLLEYAQGVKSNHGDHLNSNERFINVRDHLRVKNPHTISSDASYLIIDDVTTTGASLIYAGEYLKIAGAKGTRLLSISKNITDVL